MNPVDELTETMKLLKKPIDEVLKQPPGPKRWRAAHDLLWLNLSWRNQQIYQEVTEENRLIREMVDKNGLSLQKSSDKNMRNYINIPVGAKTAIEKADPNVFLIESNSKKFFSTFPEYTTREVF